MLGISCWNTQALSVILDFLFQTAFSEDYLVFKSETVWPLSRSGHFI